MVNFNRIKENRANHKGQSLVEVAVFGSFLLLVLGFLLNQGMAYNYQQEVKMQAFRRALQAASESNIPKQQEVELVKDVHYPDPSDMFALGQRTPTQEVSSVLWSNNSTPLDYQTPQTTPSRQYVFNPDSPPATGVTGVTRTWTTSALENYGGDIMVNRNSILNGFPEIYIVGDPSQTRVFQAEPGFGPKEVMVLMNKDIPDCNVQYCPKTILGQVQFPAARGGLQYYPVFNVTSGEVGHPPGVIAFLNKDGGQLNTSLMHQQVTNTVNDKRRSLTLNENANSYTSIEALNDDETMEHVIMIYGGGGVSNAGPTFHFKAAEPSKTWTTPKP